MKISIANSLQAAFEIYIKVEYNLVTKIPSFACFIDKNKQKLSSFFMEKLPL